MSSAYKPALGPVKSNHLLGTWRTPSAPVFMNQVFNKIITATLSVLSLFLVIYIPVRSLIIKLKRFQFTPYCCLLFRSCCCLVYFKYPCVLVLVS